MWAILAVTTALLTSFNPILYKRLLGEAGPVVVVWGVVGLAWPLLALTTVVQSTVLPRVDGVFLAAVGGSATLNAVAHLASARSLKLANASLVTPLLTFSPVFTLFISAVFLGERPGARGLAGVALTLLGAYCLTREPGSGWLIPFNAIASRPAVGLVLSAGLLWAITPSLEKLAIEHTLPSNPRFAALAVNGLLVVLLTPFALRHKDSAIGALARRRSDWLLAALIAGIAPVLGFTALSLGLVGYVTTLFRLSAVFTVIWGAGLLGETGLARRLPATFLMVVGAVLIVA